MQGLAFRDAGALLVSVQDQGLLYHLPVEWMERLISQIAGVAASV